MTDRIEGNFVIITIYGLNLVFKEEDAFKLMPLLNKSVATMKWERDHGELPQVITDSIWDAKGLTNDEYYKRLGIRATLTMEKDE